MKTILINLLLLIALSVVSFNVLACTYPDEQTTQCVASWVEPTENTDNSALTDLSGYKIYYGSSPGNYTESITIDNPGVTSFLVEGLANGTWPIPSPSRHIPEPDNTLCHILLFNSTA